MAHCKVKLTKIWVTGVYVTCMLVFLTLKMSGHLGSFGTLFRRFVCNSKTAHRRAKRTKIWALRGACNMHVFFYLEHVNVIWGHSVHFSKNWAITQKWLVVERNRGKFGFRGIRSMNVGIFDLDQKQRIIEQNRRKFGFRLCIWHACWYFWPWICHLGSFGALCQKLAIIQKRLIVEWNRRKFGPRMCM